MWSSWMSSAAICGWVGKPAICLGGGDPRQWRGDCGGTAHSSDEGPTPTPDSASGCDLLAHRRPDAALKDSLERKKTTSLRVEWAAGGRSHTGGNLSVGASFQSRD
jgi:hypothetical protein